MGNPITERNTRPLAEQVADQISQMISNRELPVGQRLPNEFELAERLNVGRGTVREAIKQLSARNIVQVKRGKGTFVVEHPGLIQDPLGYPFSRTAQNSGVTYWKSVFRLNHGVPPRRPDMQRKNKLNRCGSNAVGWMNGEKYWSIQMRNGASALM